MKDERSNDDGARVQQQQFSMRMGREDTMKEEKTITRKTLRSVRHNQNLREK